MRPPAKQRSPLPAEPCDACARSRPISGTYSVKVIPRLLGSLMGIALVATTSVALGADFDVGRVALRVIEDGWTSVGTSSDQLPFSGDLSGAIEVAKRSLLLDSEQRFRAALVVSATRGVRTIHLHWPDDCRSQANVYAVDARQDSGDTRDCLRVSGLTAIDRTLATDAPAAAAALARRRSVIPTAGYVVLDEVALANGTFVAVEALIAADVELPAGSIVQQSLPSGIDARVVAWALRLAEAARSSIHSLSGLLVVPAITAKTP